MSTIFKINNFYGGKVNISDSGNEWRALIEFLSVSSSSATTALISYWKCSLMQTGRKAENHFYTAPASKG